MRLKDISILNPQYNGESLEKEVSFVPMESLRYDALDLQEISFAEGKGKYTYFANGDLLIAKVTPCFENGNVAIAKCLKEGIGFGSSEIFVLRMNGKAYPRYMFYYVQTDNFQNKACSTMCGVGGLKRISPLFMRTYELNIPPLPIQHRIVSYLDAKTTEIDRKISLLEKKRDAYLRLKTATINHSVTRGMNPDAKLKDSGVEWIGLVPEHWEVKRLKDLGYLYSGLTGKSGDDFRNDDDSVTKLYIPFTNILYNLEVSPDLLNRVVMEESEYQNKVKKGDLIFLMSSEDYESIAKSAVVSEDIGEVYLNSFCRGYRIVKSNVDPIFVNFQLNSMIYRNRLRLEARGFTRINMKVDKIASMSVVLPSYDDQRRIVAYLREQCTCIDVMIKTIDQQAEAYKRLKRSLINEVVTGQRTV